MFVNGLHDYKLWNTVRWQEPALDKASELEAIHVWSSCKTLQYRTQGNINSLMVKYVQVWNRIFVTKYSVDGQVLVRGMCS